MKKKCLTIAEKYRKIRPFCFNDGKIQLILKPEMKHRSKIAYLRETKKLPKKYFDQYDKKVNDKKMGELQKIDVYGHPVYDLFVFNSIHSFNHEVLFKPDLGESFDAIPDILFEKSKKIYVTTDMSTNGNKQSCIITSLDKHAGITYALCVIDNDWLLKLNHCEIDKNEKQPINGLGEYHLDKNGNDVTII